jgi:serine---pyruvate transaminase
VPAGVDGQALKKSLTRDYGIVVAGGQDQAKGKIVRIAHLGYADTFDVITAISAFEMALARAGHSFALGAGVRRAMEVLNGGVR